MTASAIISRIYTNGKKFLYTIYKKLNIFCAIGKMSSWWCTIYNKINRRNNQKNDANREPTDVVARSARSAPYFPADPCESQRRTDGGGLCAGASARAAEGDVFDFVRTPYRTLKQNRGTSARWSAPKIRQIGLTKIVSTVTDGIDSVTPIRIVAAQNTAAVVTADIASIKAIFAKPVAPLLGTWYRVGARYHNSHKL